MLMGYGGLNLPSDVPANQYITFKGEKASKSQARRRLWLLASSSATIPTRIRYALAANLPETSDTDFTEAEFIRRNNDELVATWGNLVNRVLAMTQRTSTAACRSPAPSTHRDERLLEHAPRRSYTRSAQPSRPCT